MDNARGGDQVPGQSVGVGPPGGAGAPGTLLFQGKDAFFHRI